MESTPQSAVLFSTRWERPEAQQIATTFGATHITWLYPKTRAYVAELQSAGFSVGTTLNANQAVPDEGLARDLEGKALVAPWMQSWGARWISIASPATRAALLAAAQRQLDWGASSIQFDDPALATASFGWGGDFSTAAVQGFGRWLAGPGAIIFPDLPAETRSGQFDYRNWLAELGIRTTPYYLQRRSKLSLNTAWERYHLEQVRGFFKELRSALHAATKPATLSLNLTNPAPDARTFNLIDLTDGILSEITSSDLANAALTAATAQGAGVRFYTSLTPHSLPETRRQIAGFYALGALPVVPWDVYMPDRISADKQRTPQPRYFGTPAEYADLYQFVRQHPDLFDGRESLEYVLLLVQVEHFKAAEVLAIVRALQAKQIPFGIQVARSGYPARSFDAQRIARAPAVMFASDFSGLDQPSLAALAAAEGKRIRPETLDAAHLAPLSLQSPAPVMVMPRFDPARPHELIVHLVRSGDGPIGPLNLQLNPVLLPFKQISSIELFAPALPAAQAISTQGLTFTVPMDGDWAVLRLQLH